jgi:circadian clock protein KaiC
VRQTILATSLTGQELPLTKSPTGISGFDTISGGGLPDGRLSVIVGGPGAGKTVFALHCLVHRLTALGEAGIFVSFEEDVDRIRANMAAFDWTVPGGNEQLKFIDARLPVETRQGGDFDLSGLLAGLGSLAAETRARTVVFDGIGVLLSALDDEKLEKKELARLEEWIRESGLSALITAKSFGSNEREQRRSDLLQYMTDCAVELEKIYSSTTSSRSLRILKYRGSGFAANPMPAVITRAGFEIVALSATRLDYRTFTDRVSSGIAGLDKLLDGGYLRGSSVLVSGSPGTSKTSLGASFAAAACARGERVLFVSFDESGAQIARNVLSIGLDLAPYIASGRLIMASEFSGGFSPEEHFVTIRELIRRHAPDCVAIDPLSALMKGDYAFANIICESVLDQAKCRGITLMCTSLLDQAGMDQEISASHVSTIADTWIHVSYVAREGERNRALTIIKSRGTRHSNQVRELSLGRSGIELCDVYAAEGEVLMGSARRQKEAEDRRRHLEYEIALKRKRMQTDYEIAELKARISAMTQEMEWKQSAAELTATLESRLTTLEQEAAAERMHMRLSNADFGSGTPS